MSNFKENLVALRKAAGISQKDFAQMLDIPITTLSGYENGGREPKFDLLIKMARLLSVTIDDLLQRELDEKFNLLIRDKFQSKVRAQIIGDSVVITFPHENKEQMILSMQILADLLNFVTSLVVENGEVDMTKKFFLKFSDVQETKKED